MRIVVSFLLISAVFGVTTTSSPAPRATFALRARGQEMNEGSEFDDFIVRPVAGGRRVIGDVEASELDQ